MSQNCWPTARAVFALAWLHYELLVVAGMWSLLAVEAALRVRLESEQGGPRKGREPRFIQLVRRAQEEGLITEEWAGRLDAPRQMRNGLAHAQDQQVWTVGMAASVLTAAHEVIAVLYPDSPAARSGPGRRPSGRASPSTRCSFQQARPCSTSFFDSNIQRLSTHQIDQTFDTSRFGL